jgi:hypothetical protein
MDQFEDVSRRMAAMTPEQQHKAVAEAKAFCECARCPSFGPHARDGGQLLFCTLGRATDACQGNGCSCGHCAAKKMLGLRHERFCALGTEKEQRGMR